MGIAAILIIICHMPAHDVAMPSLIRSIVVHGGAGCDMFLFLSGLGMYHSFNRRETSDRGILRWLSRRYIRILVPYFIIAIPCLAIDAFNSQTTVWQFLLQLSTISFWINGKGLWFIALLLFLYLITPVLDVVIKHHKHWFLILILITWGIGSIQGLQGSATHIQFGICRIPSYLIGYMLAKEILSSKKISWGSVLIPIVLGLVVAAIINKVTSFQISYFWLEGLFLLLLFALVIDRFYSYRFMELLRFMGGISLESYCTNVLLLSRFRGLPYVFGNINLNPGNWTFYVLGTICCLLVSVLVNRASKKIIGLWSIAR